MKLERSRWIQTWVVAVSLGVAAPVATACLWDYDTLAEESLSDRDVAAVLRGDLHKHAAEFYAAKVTYTRALIDAGNAPKERYDDLAVALARTGAIDEALVVLDQKELRFPGEYTTLANRGTFQAMKGDVPAALVSLRAAVAKNPDAHFGREEFQIRLLEYKLRVAKDASLRQRESFVGPVGKDQLHSLETAHVKDDPALDRQIKALVGLIRFGDGDRDADVWYALAWALVQRGDNLLGVLALRKADLLGHPVARAQGGVRATTLRKFDPPSPCCPDPGDPRAEATWDKVVPHLDRAIARGTAAAARRQAGELRLIKARKWRKLFGY